MSDLYPEIKPFAVQRLAVNGGHSLYVEQCGRQDGVPVVFLHGGPGAGCEPYHRQFFDPAVYRAVLFDQRGCGRSTPHAEIVCNTTPDLIADIERIRSALGIEQWLVFGGSWGSTLGLAYAQAHPERVLGLVLRGIFLCRRWELEWFYQEGASRVYPDYWEDFLAPIPPEERGNLMAAYLARLCGEDEVARMAAAKAWARWEARTATLNPSEAVVGHFEDPHTALSLARIECHYFNNDAFLEPSQLLRDAPRLAGVPGVIVHGRYDLICPLQSAWELHGAWPGSELRVIGDAGHAACEPGVRQALIDATDAFARMLA